MLKISQKRFFVSLDEVPVCGNRYKIVNDRMGVRWREKRAFATQEFGIKNQIFLDKPEVGILISIN